MRAGLVPLLAGWPDAAAALAPRGGGGGGGGGAWGGDAGDGASGAAAADADAQPLCWTDALFDGGDALDVPLVGEATLWEAMLLEGGTGAEGVAEAGGATACEDVSPRVNAPPLLPPPPRREARACDGLRCLDATHELDCDRCARRAPPPPPQRWHAHGRRLPEGSRATTGKARAHAPNAPPPRHTGGPRCTSRRGRVATGRTVAHGAHGALASVASRVAPFACRNALTRALCAAPTAQLRAAAAAWSRRGGDAPAQARARARAACATPHVPALRCATHASRCVRATACIPLPVPPHCSKGAGSGAGEKRLRRLLLACPEWNNADARARAADAALADGDTRTAECVRAKASPALRKASMIALVRLWGYKCDVFHLQPEEVEGALRIACCCACAGRVCVCVWVRVLAQSLRVCAR
jgi:hypothetical protein